MKNKCIFFIFLLILLNAFSFSSFCAIVCDIEDRVSWDDGRSMYVPDQYSRYWAFEGYTPADERVSGGMFLDLTGQNRFDLYLSNSELSDPEVRLTRVSIEQIPGLIFPYEIKEYGYLPAGEEDPSIHYDFSTEETGFGECMLDWQLQAENPMPHHSVYPTSVYYASIEGSGEIDHDILAAMHLKAILKAQGTESVKIYAENTIIGGGFDGNGPEIPELPSGSMPVIAVLFVSARLLVRSVKCRGSRLFF